MAVTSNPLYDRKDCAKLIGAEPDWVFWHQWPDHRLHNHDDPGQGLAFTLLGRKGLSFLNDSTAEADASYRAFGAFLSQR